MKHEGEKLEEWQTIDSVQWKLTASHKSATWVYKESLAVNLERILKKYLEGHHSKNRKAAAQNIYDAAKKTIDEGTADELHSTHLLIKLIQTEMSENKVTETGKNRQPSLLFIVIKYALSMAYQNSLYKENEKLQKENIELKSENAKFQEVSDELAQAKRKMATMKEGFSDALEKANELQKQSEQKIKTSAQRQYKQVQVKYQKQINGLEKEIAEKTKVIESLRDTLANPETLKSYRVLGTQLAKNEVERLKLRSENTKLKSALKTARKDLAGLNNRMLAVQKENGDLKLELKSYQKSLLKIVGKLLGTKSSLYGKLNLYFSYQVAGSGSKVERAVGEFAKDVKTDAKLLAKQQRKTFGTERKKEAPKHKEGKKSPEAKGKPRKSITPRRK